MTFDKNTKKGLAMDFNEMMEHFKGRFEQYGKDDFKHPDGEKWIFAHAWPEKVNAYPELKGFHYELISRGADAGAECHIELHFELYRYQWSTLREALVSKFAEDEYRRDVVATSYYSSLIWKVRRPVFSKKHIEDDVKLLQEAVGKVLAGKWDISQMSDSNNQRNGEEELVLPCYLPIEQIAGMLREGVKVNRAPCRNCLTIPAVQRGKVWNAARIETLWDSIFRGFPIGALSVRCKEGNVHEFDILDGQQRATAISLGFDILPSLKNHKYDSILWIDLVRADGEEQYRFFVTTTSQPWGYAESSSETRNSLLPTSERRRAAITLPEDEWEKGQVKPYPFQLYPARARAPVPYTLLRVYAEETLRNKNQVDFDDFRKTFLDGKFGMNKFLINEILPKADVRPKDFKNLCDKIASISKDYTVFFLDASSVTEKDIALYFTRIGKGGVVPNDEELAYSVLKSKLDSGFRKTIQDIHEKYGLATESRIAHLAIRLFKSEYDQDKTGKPQFYSGSVFSVVMDMCKDENASEKQLFSEFIREKFEARIKKVESDYQLTQWHSARYASERDGDVFLMLLLAAGDVFAGSFTSYNVKGLAELLFGYASDVGYSMRKILEEGVPIAIANLANDTFYGKRRLTLPISSTKFDNINVDSIDSLLKWKDDNPEAAQTLAGGYNNSNHDHAYNILLYACKDSILNNKFKYNKELGLWAEDNCPWDYDHIMPHSTIEKMCDPDYSSDEQEACEWLKNSIGNLAPLPFWLNRSLSDSARDKDYPSGEQKEQEALHIKGESVKDMWNGDKINPEKFCKAVIERYCAMYSAWYKDLGIGGLVNFKSALETQRTDLPMLWKGAIHRYTVFDALHKKLQEKGFELKRIVADNKEQKVPEEGLYELFCRNDVRTSNGVITLSVDINRLSVALSTVNIKESWEIGLRKCSEDLATNDEIYNKVAKAIGNDVSSGFFSRDKMCKGNAWWYWCAEKPKGGEENLEGEINEILKMLNDLYEIAQQID